MDQIFILLYIFLILEIFYLLEILDVNFCIYLFFVIINKIVPMTFKITIYNKKNKKNIIFGKRYFKNEINKALIT